MKKYLIMTLPKHGKLYPNFHVREDDSMKSALEEVLLEYEDVIIASVSQLEDDVEMKDLGWDEL